MNYFTIAEVELGYVAIRVPTVILDKLAVEVASGLKCRLDSFKGQLSGQNQFDEAWLQDGTYQGLWSSVELVFNLTRFWSNGSIVHNLDEKQLKIIYDALVEFTFWKNSFKAYRENIHGQLGTSPEDSINLVDYLKRILEPIPS